MDAVKEGLINQIFPQEVQGPRAKTFLEWRLGVNTKGTVSKKAAHECPLLPILMFSERQKEQDDSSLWYLCIYQVCKNTKCSLSPDLSLPLSTDY